MGTNSLFFAISAHYKFSSYVEIHYLCTEKQQNLMERIIGREREIEKLQEYADSEKAEFIALYGRRRVGKTFLVRSFFKDKFEFYATGIIDGSMAEQMEAFHLALCRFGYKGVKADTWMQAFGQLADLLETKNRRHSGRLVVFIDELPCFDTTRSGFLHALDHFWNSRASWMSNIFLVICGSATSWMIKNIVNNKAGLHKRTTHNIHLRPFTLHQTELYFQYHKFRWPRITILQMYMILGGVPYYLSMIDPKKNLPDNVDSLFFAEDAELKGEYRRLFSSLFKNADLYMDILRVLSTRKYGYTRKEIAEALKIADNGHLCTMMEDLEYCDFVRRYNNGAAKNNGIYQLMDFYTQFFYAFCTRSITDEHYWRNHLGTPEQNTWYGLTFEKVCMWHVRQIVHGLHFDTIAHEYYSWRSKECQPMTQIDMIIDRADGIATICEMKYSKDDYSINENEYRKLIRRLESFEKETRRKGGTQISIVTTYALRDNMYAEISPNHITMEQLFEQV